MPVQDLEKDKLVAPQKKTNPPPQWQVVMHYNAPRPIQCAMCILHDVFNLPASKAGDVIRAGIRQGKISLLEASRDVVETKTAEAEDERLSRISRCTAALKAVRFEAKPR